MTSFSDPFSTLTVPFGAAIFSPILDVRGDDPTPPGTIFLAAENGDNLLLENADNYTIE
jgi:hypothetical protein